MRALACAVLLAGPAAATAAEPSEVCTVDVRLTSVACNAAHDETEKHGARGEYFIRLGTGPEVGPFELRAGESSSFSPGLLLDVIDTGVLASADGGEIPVPIELHLSAREADSGRPGEDDTDDLSAPVPVRERVVCPGGTTGISRGIEIEASVSDRRGAGGTRAARRKNDKLKVSLKLIASE